MPVEAACPSCEGKFRLPDAAAGKKIRCPKCKGPLEVPPLTAAEPAAPTVVAAPTMTQDAPIQKAPTPPASPTDNLRKTWRSASQEPAPVEQPRKEPLRVETAKPQLAPIVAPAKPAATTASPKPALPPTPAAKPKAAEKAPANAPEQPLEQWFLKGEDGETFGPVDRATLDSWRDEGRMTADSQLLKHGTEQWQWASDIYPELDEPEPEPATPPAAATSTIQKTLATTTGTSSVSRNPKPTRPVPVPDADEDEEAGLSPHSKPVAVLLGFTLGMFGIHRFYLGYVGIGLAMFFTLGGLMIWSITDSLRILFGHVTDSEGLKLRD